MALEQERARLQSSVDVLGQAEQTLAQGEHDESGGGGSQADVATDFAEQTLDLTLEQTERDRLSEVDAALHRLAIGEYGVCAGCGQEIPLDRLQAIPWTRYCVTCASKHNPV